MEQPPGYVKEGHEQQVCRLRKSLYGLKQSARSWNQYATTTLEKLGFQPSQADQCLYTQVEKSGTMMYALLYVDDLLVAGATAKITLCVGQQLNKYFEVRDLGEVTYYLGI